MAMVTNVTRTRVAWSLGELSSSYGVSIGLLRKEIRLGRLKSRRLGRRIVVLVSDLEDYLSSGAATKSKAAGHQTTRKRRDEC
jgi:hypothetical protein